MEAIVSFAYNLYNPYNIQLILFLSKPKASFVLQESLYEMITSINSMVSNT